METAFQTLQALESLDMNQVIADPRVGIVMVLMVIGWLMKSATSMSNKYIPLILAALGIALGVIFFASTAGYVGGGMVGLLYAAIAIGMHSGLKNSTRNDS